MIRRLLLILLVSMLGISGPAATFAQTEGKVSSAAVSEAVYPAAEAGWKIVKEQMRYRTSEGKYLKGMQTIGDKTFYFDASGNQKTGWQKIDEDYYFFRIAAGKKGYMQCSVTVNGIKLASNGKAKQTKSGLAKLKVLVKAAKIAESCTKAMMTKEEKLIKVWTKVLSYRYRGAPGFRKSEQWDVVYAADMMNKGYGNCYAYGATFAYLANACGYTTVKAVSSGGHGWAEVDGYVYDPSWEKVDTKHSYFKVPMSQSGIGGRPNYKRGRLYIRNI